jgi:dipeptide/tripeptide permease
MILVTRPSSSFGFCSFLDKAAILEPAELDARAAAAAATSCKEIIITSSPWRLSTVTQVEEVKLVLRLLPIWVAALLFATLPAQISTFYTRQGTTLDINLGPNFRIPAASLQSLIPITIVTLIPLYDRVFVPVVRHFTGNVRGITMLQRIGIGIFISILSMVAAAITEIKRVKVRFPLLQFWMHQAELGQIFFLLQAACGFFWFRALGFLARF